MRRGMGRAAALAIAGALGTVSMRAGAQAPDASDKSVAMERMTLSYTRARGAESCDDERAFREWLASELGEDPFVEPDATHTTARRKAVRMIVAPAGSVFEASLILETARGHETLHEVRPGRTCNDALDRLAIDVLLGLFRRGSPGSSASDAADEECDPCADRVRGEARREIARLRRELSRARVAQEEQRQATEARISALEAEYRRRMDVTFALSTGAFLTLGLTNNVGGGVLLGGEVHSGIFAVGLEARLTFPSEFGPKKIDDDWGDYSRFQGSLVPCARYWYVFGCAVLSFGAEFMHRAPAYTGPKPSVGIVWDSGPRLGAEVPIGDVFALRAWGEVLFNPYPTIYGWDVNHVPVSEKQLPVVAGFVGVGLVIHFGKQQ